MIATVVALFEGASLGGIYALIGVGLVLAYRATGTLSFAHGELMLLTAYLLGSWYSVSRVPFGWALVLSLAITAGVCALFYILVLRRIAGMPHFIGFIATLGLAQIISSYLAIQFGSNQYSIVIPGIPAGSFKVVGAGISESQVVLTGVSFAVVILLAAVLRFTAIGTRVRAAGQDALLASQSGININRVYLGSWAVTGLLAALAGIVAGSTQLVGPGLADLALAAFPAILLGGLDSVEGALLGGVIIGMVQAFVAGFWGEQYVDLSTYSILLAVMLVYPQGLLGTRRALRM